MVLLPYSGVENAAESDCSNKPNQGTAYAYSGELICVQNKEYLVFEDDKMNEPGLTSENTPSTVEMIESESPNNNRVSFFKWLEKDEPTAVWFKWRGEWQAGIKCGRADWSLSALKSKPSSDQMKYVLIFSLDTRDLSWADILNVESIDKFPQPIPYKTHEEGLQMVKDLTIARRFQMQKLAVDMLSIVDQFHSNALVETARDVMVWKQFAMEASHCHGYSDLGRMLQSLQNSILQNYIKADWILYSSKSWAERCKNANSAILVELLKEELYVSILWNDVNNLWDAALAQPKLGSEWKAWKNDVMKWFSIFPSLSRNKDMMQQDASNGLHQVSLQVCRKRPKLTVRRADTLPSMVDSLSALAAVNSELEDIVEVPVLTDIPGNLNTHWKEIVVEPTYSEIMLSNGTESRPMEEIPVQNVLESGTENQQCQAHIEVTGRPDVRPVVGGDEMAVPKFVESGNKNAQCQAYIEAKGRQCVRPVVGGDIYCCVHFSERVLGGSRKTERPVTIVTPICSGTTIAGTRCKHHSLPGFLFCKKHQNETSNSSHNTLKRKIDESCSGSNGLICKDNVLVNDGSPLQIDSVSDDDDSFSGRNNLGELLMLSGNDYHVMEALQCIGSPHYGNGNEDSCFEAPKWYSLYCEKHLPNWLKNATNGKSRIISNEVFTDNLTGCSSLEQKVHLHKACMIFYKLFRSILSQKNLESNEARFQWALAEASKETSVGDFFYKLVHSEKERIKLTWGFDGDVNATSLMEGLSRLRSASMNDNAIKCKICFAEFSDDQTLCNHWMENHKKEAEWLFRGYACAICLDSFANKKLLESHVKERHRVEFVEQCLLFLCIPCGGHFGNMEELLLHVVSAHPVEFKPSKAHPSPERQTLSTSDDSLELIEQGNEAPLDNNNSENQDSLRKFCCRFCGMKFNLLPDLGRHHQATHMDRNLASRRLARREVRHYAHRLKSGRISHPKFKKGLSEASYRGIRNRANANLKRKNKETRLLEVGETSTQPHVNETENIGHPEDCKYSLIVKILLSEIHKIKPRPNNIDILSIARSSCCKVNLKASLEENFGTFPESFYARAAKLCSENGIQVNWHQKEFICLRGCNASNDENLIPRLALPSNDQMMQNSVNISDIAINELEKNEFHCIVNMHTLKFGSLQNDIVLCDDISFGKESTPVICVLDQEILNSLFEQDVNLSMPWESFTYVTKPMLDRSLTLYSQSLHLRCSCSSSTCCHETCDHIYLFDNDYDDAKDIFGKPMRGRFPYNENGRIILEEGYLVYECNHMCKCDKTCPNRILQNGVQVKLEVFKTEKKGWAVRAGEAIPRGTFVCEFIGEVIGQQEALKRCERYGKEHCSYLYDTDAHVNDIGRLIGEQARYVIDSTTYGNVSRFINNSCSPNLVNYQVLVESMDCERSHIGLYASRDIALGEELTYNYHYELVPGEGSPCLCGSSKCRGRLY